MKKAQGISAHQAATMRTDEWLTPPEILHALGTFDLDPCAPINRPWNMAAQHFTIIDNGLLKQWTGRIWMNPPYGNQTEKWMQKLSSQGNGISLIFARTETKIFFPYVWELADSIFFFKKRLHFCTIDGKRTKTNAGGPSCLISYGENNSQSIVESRLQGRHLPINYTPVIVVGISPSWKCVVKIALTRLKDEGNVQAIYEVVEQLAPDKVSNNAHYKEKIRQTLQRHFTSIKKGHWTTSTTEV